MAAHQQDNPSKVNDVRSSSPILCKISSGNGAFTILNEGKPKLAENCTICGCSANSTTTSEDPKECSNWNNPGFRPMSFYGRQKPTVQEVLEKAKNIEKSEDGDKIYDKIDCWNFPIFDAWDNGNVLRGVSIVIFT